MSLYRREDDISEQLPQNFLFVWYRSKLGGDFKSGIFGVSFTAQLPNQEKEMT